MGIGVFYVFLYFSSANKRDPNFICCANFRRAFTLHLVCIEDSLATFAYLRHVALFSVCKDLKCVKILIRPALWEEEGIKKTKKTGLVTCLPLDEKKSSCPSSCYFFKNVIPN